MSDVYCITGGKGVKTRLCRGAPRTWSNCLTEWEGLNSNLLAQDAASHLRAQEVACSGTKSSSDARCPRVEERCRKATPKRRRRVEHRRSRLSCPHGATLSAAGLTDRIRPYPCCPVGKNCLPVPRVSGARLRNCQGSALLQANCRLRGSGSDFRPRWCGTRAWCHPSPPVPDIRGRSPAHTSRQAAPNRGMHRASPEPSALRA